MNDFEIQFGNDDPEFDFSSDITGETRQSRAIEEPPSSGLPNNFWFQNNSGFNLIYNNEKPGNADDKFSDEVRKNEHQVVFQKVYKMAMMGSPALELERILKLTFSPQDFSSIPFLRQSLFLLPLVGPVFWECWAFKSEEEAKSELKHRKDIKPIFVRECLKCRSCRFKNSLSPSTEYCSKIGLPIFKNDFSSPPPKKVIQHLQIAGYLIDTTKEYSWDDIRSLVIFPLQSQNTRQYEQFVPPQKEILAGAKFRRAYREINKMNNDLRTIKESEAQTRLNQTIIFPIIVKVQEIILKNRQNDKAANVVIRGMFLPECQKEKSNEIVDSLQQDVYLWATIRWYLPPYKRCDDANKFLRANHLRPPYARDRLECASCIDNKGGFCKRLESRLVSSSEEIPLAVRMNAIEFIGSDRNIDHEILDYCKRLENMSPKAGLKKLRETLNSNFTAPVYSGAGIQDLDKLPVRLLDGNKNMTWITNKLKNGSSLLLIEREVKQAIGSKKGEALIQEVILSQGIVPSDRNELCLTTYEVVPCSNLNRLERCKVCSSAGDLYCKKYSRVLIDSSMAIPPEGPEILSYFSDLPLDTKVQIDPVRTEKSLDIEMENPGEHLPVDVRIGKPLDEQKIWYEAQRQELKIDAPEPIEFDSPLDIELGEKGDGMILDDSLL